MRTLLSNILRRKANWIGHILRTNYLPHDVIERQMTEVKGVGSRTQLLDDLKNRKVYLELQKEAEDKKYGNDSLSFKHMNLPCMSHAI